MDKQRLSLRDKVYILVEGYAHPGPKGSYIASPSAVLIKTKNKKILVDPGSNKEKLFKGLKKLNLKPSDLSFIYLSHYHVDHILNVKYFPNLDVYDGTTIWKDDKEYFYKDNIPGTNIEILPTPGHSTEHSSLLVKTKDGIVCVAADVFWWEDGKQKSDTTKDLLNLKDPFMTDNKALLRSRKLILEKSDWIIPGHGKMFKNPLR